MLLGCDGWCDIVDVFVFCGMIFWFECFVIDVVVYYVVGDVDVVVFGDWIGDLFGWYVFLDIVGYVFVVNVFVVVWYYVFEEVL